MDARDKPGHDDFDMVPILLSAFRVKALSIELIGSDITRRGDSRAANKAGEFSALFSSAMPKAGF